MVIRKTDLITLSTTLLTNLLRHSYGDNTASSDGEIPIETLKISTPKNKKWNTTDSTLADSVTKDNKTEAPLPPAETDCHKAVAGGMYNPDTIPNHYSLASKLFAFPKPGTDTIGNSDDPKHKTMKRKHKDTPKLVK